MKGCLLIPLAFIASFAIGIGVTAILQLCGIKEETAALFGTGAWLFSFMLMLPYGSLWLSDPEDFAAPDPPKPRPWWHSRKAEGKLQTAEISMGTVFAMIGGAMAAIADASNYVIAAVVIPCAIIGILVGYDFKRRVLRIREQLKQNAS